MCDTIHWDFCHSLYPKWVAWFKSLNEYRLQLRHLMGLKNMIILQVTFPRDPFVIINHFLAYCISECLCHPTFNLPRRREWIDDYTGIYCGYQFIHSNLTRINIQCHFGKL